MHNAITVSILPNESSSPAGKLADAELRFGPGAGPLSGLKLIGFSIWQGRGTGVAASHRNVTFPARSFSVNGERRSFALLRPIVESGAQDAIRALILDAYAELDATNRAEPATDHTGRVVGSVDA